MVPSPVVIDFLKKIKEQEIEEDNRPRLHIEPPVDEEEEKTSERETEHG